MSYSYQAVVETNNATFGYSHVTGIDIRDLTYVNVSSFQGVVSMNAGDVYPFDKITQGNINSNYDTNNFTYSASVDGRYMINTMITTTSASGSGGPGICINGVLALICTSQLTGSGSTVYVTNLTAGDKVTIEHFGIAHNVDMSDNYCMFSVDLI